MDFSLENLKLKTWEKFSSTREAENEDHELSIDYSEPKPCADFDRVK